MLKLLVGLENIDYFINTGHSVPLHQFLLNIRKSRQCVKVHSLSTSPCLLIFSVFHLFVSQQALFVQCWLLFFSLILNDKFSWFFIPLDFEFKKRLFEKIENTTRTVSTSRIWTSLDSKPYFLTFGALFNEISDIDFFSRRPLNWVLK